ncbi:MAG: heme o synthase [Chloroflexota bacterium]
MSVSESTEHNNTSSGLMAHKHAGWRTNLQILMVLFKSRVVSLLLLAATGGAFLAAGGWPGWATMILVIVSGGLTASGSSGLNQYLEQGSDALMGRTRKRPLVTGKLQPRWVLWVSILMVVIPPLLIVSFNPALAFFLLAGAVIYVVLYTLILKPRTLLNIVIGGAAGSMAVMSGGAAVGAWREPAVIALALLVFLWTPSHFWSLAILYRNDYARADVPMLPVSTTVGQAAWWVFLHTGAAGAVALLMAVTPDLGLVYLVPVALATADIVVRNVRLIREPTPRRARALFISSNIFLTIVLLAACLGTVLNGV